MLTNNAVSLNQRLATEETAVSYDALVAAEKAKAEKLHGAITSEVPEPAEEDEAAECADEDGSSAEAVATPAKKAKAKASQKRKVGKK